MPSLLSIMLFIFDVRLAWFTDPNQTRIWDADASMEAANLDNSLCTKEECLTTGSCWIHAYPRYSALFSIQTTVDLLEQTLYSLWLNWIEFTSHLSTIIGAKTYTTFWTAVDAIVKRFNWYKTKARPQSIKRSWSCGDSICLGLEKAVSI